MKAKKNIVLLELIFICWLVVGMWNHSWASDFGPFQGRILDAETREPVEGVVVLIEWRELHFFAGATFYDAQETLTDKNGEFYIPGIWVFNPWTRLGIEAYVTIYRSGYGTGVGHDFTGVWKALLEKEWGAPKGTFILKFEDSKPVFLLKKLMDPEERKKNIPSEPSVPEEKQYLLKEKWKLLRQEINKEHKFLGLGEID